VRGNRFALGRNPDWKIYALIYALDKLHHNGTVFADGDRRTFFSARAGLVDCCDGLRRHCRLRATTKGKTAKNKFIVRLKGFSWTREDFCRGWLITGDTGSGKTRSGINQLLFQVFQNDPNWGGCALMTRRLLGNARGDGSKIQSSGRFDFVASQAGQPAG